MTSGAALVRALGSVGLAALFVLVPAPQARAADAVVAEQVGDTNLLLPAPPGFMEPRASLPQLRKLGDMITPTANRLLAMFVGDDDFDLAVAGNAPAMARYFMVQTLRAAEGGVVSADEFAQVRAYLRAQHQAVLDNAAPAVRRQLEQVSRAVGKDTGVPDLQLEVGELQSIEIFDDTRNSISLLALVKYLVQSAGRTQETTMVAGITTAVVKGRLLYLYVYSRLRSAEDLAWVRVQTTAWLAQIARAN